MSEHQAQIDTLVHEALGLPLGPTQVSLLEEAVRLSDLHSDLDRSFETRNQLMRAALFSGRVDLLMVAFAWSVATFDQHPGRFDERRLLWKYKWVTGEAVYFPHIPRARIDELLADMERRCLQAGYGQHAVAARRRDCCVEMNDSPAAEIAQVAFQSCERDLLSDCAACVVAGNGDYFALQQAWEAQIRALEPVLSGRLSCLTQPLSSTCKALLTLLRLGRTAEAEAMQRRYGPRLKLNNDHAANACRHVTFLALQGSVAQARRIFEKFFAEAMESVKPTDQLRLMRAGVVLLDRTAAVQGVDTLKLALRVELPDLPVAREGSYEIAPLREWMYGQALKISRAYDVRNGNDGEERATQQLPQLIEKFSAA